MSVYFTSNNCVINFLLSLYYNIRKRDSHHSLLIRDLNLTVQKTSTKTLPRTTPPNPCYINHLIYELCYFVRLFVHFKSSQNFFQNCFLLKRIIAIDSSTPVIVAPNMIVNTTELGIFAILGIIGMIEI